MDWQKIGFWLEDAMARWWWAYIILGSIVLPLMLAAMGFGGAGTSPDGCVRYSSFAESC